MHRRFEKRLSVVLRQTHRAGEKVFVDFCDGLSLIDPLTGELIPTQLFVGALGASSYTFATATLSQELPVWLDCRLRMFEFFGGVSSLTICDNLRAGVTTPDRYEAEINASYIDPLYAQLPSALIPGTAAPEQVGLIEDIVAVGLFRSGASTLIHASAVPTGVGYWRSTDDRENDFVVPRASEPDNPARFPIEVKGDNLTGISNARSAIKRTFKQGIVTSFSRFQWDGEVPVLPVWLMPAGLRENAYRPVAIA